MSAWAYCGKCDKPIHKKDYSIDDVVTQKYACPSCGHLNRLQGHGMPELLNGFGNRISALEAKLEEVEGKS